MVELLVRPGNQGLMDHPDRRALRDIMAKRARKVTSFLWTTGSRGTSGQDLPDHPGLQGETDRMEPMAGTVSQDLREKLEPLVDRDIQEQTEREDLPDHKDHKRPRETKESLDRRAKMDPRECLESMEMMANQAKTVFRVGKVGKATLASLALLELLELLECQVK